MFKHAYISDLENLKKIIVNIIGEKYTSYHFKTIREAVEFIQNEGYELVCSDKKGRIWFKSKIKQ